MMTTVFLTFFSHRDKDDDSEREMKERRKKVRQTDKEEEGAFRGIIEGGKGETREEIRDEFDDDDSSNILEVSYESHSESEVSSTSTSIHDDNDTDADVSNGEILLHNFVYGSNKSDMNSKMSLIREEDDDSDSDDNEESYRSFYLSRNNINNSRSHTHD